MSEITNTQGSPAPEQATPATPSTEGQQIAGTPTAPEQAQPEATPAQ